MQGKRLFEPGDSVVSFAGQIGLVLSLEEFGQAKARLREGRRPGHYFAPGCCANPDYLTQVPVLFEDGTYDVMKGMNLKKKTDVQEERRARIQRILRMWSSDHLHLVPRVPGTPPLPITNWDLCPGNKQALKETAETITEALKSLPAHE